MNKNNFYDFYHRKNDKYKKIISDNNFTYFYTLQWLQEGYKNGPKKKSVLDVACGVGTLSFFLAKKGLKVTGIDISKRAIDIAKNTLNFHLELKNRLNFVLGDVEKFSFGKKYDLILCSEIIEHLEDDKKFLKKVNLLLKNDGILYISTPSKNNLLYKIGFYKKFDLEVGHLRRYTKESLNKLLEESGYVVIKMRGTESVLRNILFTTKLGFLIRFIRGPLVSIFHFFDLIFVRIFGETDIQVIAKKR